jgi:hypothetical protein
MSVFAGNNPTPINIQRPNSDLNKAKYSDGMMAAAYALCPSMHTDKKTEWKRSEERCWFVPCFFFEFLLIKGKICTTVLSSKKRP